MVFEVGMLIPFWPEQFAQSWKDVIELVFIVSAVIIGLIQLQLLLRQTREQQEETNAEIVRERRRRTLELDAKIAELASERAVLEKVFPPSQWKSPIPVDVVQDALDKNPGLEVSLTKLLAQFEIFSLPIWAESGDEDMAFELIGGALIWLGTAFSDFIEFKRNQYNRPRLYIYLTYTAEKWKKRVNAENEIWAQNPKPFFVRMKEEKPLKTR